MTRRHLKYTIIPAAKISTIGAGYPVGQATRPGTVGAERAVARFVDPWPPNADPSLPTVPVEPSLGPAGLLSLLGGLAYPRCLQGRCQSGSRSHQGHLPD